MANKKVRKSASASTSSVKSANIPDGASNMAVLGTYEGECADARVTNLNGLDITDEVWKNVFNSDEYKNAIDHGWYIGYLGHPEDPNCMDFKDACIVMTEGHIEDNGKVYGKFNLIDTPVGRVVKAFQDAGVVFGISVRGAGDIVDNSVDPETFIFRGFDLVTFPAFPDSIPTFTELAASSDIDKQKKYKAICSAVSANIQKIDNVNSLNVLQSQFAAQSDTFKSIESRKQELLGDVVDLHKSKPPKPDSDECEPGCNNCEDDEFIGNVYAEKLNAMTQLYLEQVDANNRLRSELRSVKSSSERKLSSVRRILSVQLKDIQDNSKIECSQLQEKVDALQERNLKYRQRISACNADMSSQNSRIKSLNNQLVSEKAKRRELESELSASQNDAQEKDSVIASLNTKLSETIASVEDLENRASNRDEATKKLRSELKASRTLVQQYQDAYAALYASALGTTLDHVTVTATTSVKELQSIIGSTSTANIPTGVFVEPNPVEIVEDDAEDDDQDLIVI